jgi:hypothetical protein
MSSLKIFSAFFQTQQILPVNNQFHWQVATQKLYVLVKKVSRTALLAAG